MDKTALAVYITAISGVVLTNTVMLPHVLVDSVILVWKTASLIEGLLFDLIGATIVLFPEITRLGDFFVPAERIDRIDSARQRMLDGKVDEQHRGFNELVSVIQKYSEIDVIPNRYETDG
jgi:hypothetical protein